jgi:hypothetical protein
MLSVVQMPLVSRGSTVSLLGKAHHTALPTSLYALFFPRSLQAAMARTRL